MSQEVHKVTMHRQQLKRSYEHLLLVLTAARADVALLQLVPEAASAALSPDPAQAKLAELQSTHAQTRTSLVVAELVFGRSLPAASCGALTPTAL